MSVMSPNKMLVLTCNQHQVDNTRLKRRKLYCIEYFSLFFLKMLQIMICRLIHHSAYVTIM